MEGNPKHIQELLKTSGMESCKSVNTPMTAEDYKDDDFKKTDFQRRELTVAEAKLYRRGTALCVYISQDRGDISAATCQLATKMATPTEYDWERLKRVCRYLKGSPRFKYVYHWQATDDVKLRLLTDSDWANEARSRKVSQWWSSAGRRTSSSTLVPTSTGGGAQLWRSGGLQCRVRFEQAHWRVERLEGDEGRVLG